MASAELMHQNDQQLNFMCLSCSEPTLVIVIVTDLVHLAAGWCVSDLHTLHLLLGPDGVRKSVAFFCPGHLLCGSRDGCDLPCKHRSIEIVWSVAQQLGWEG